MTKVMTLQEEKEGKLSRIINDERGLTMIELLATVVILAIILGVGAMAIGQVIQNSREDATVAEVQNAVQSAKLYLASTDGTAAGQSTAGTFTLKEVVAAKYFKPQAKNVTVAEQENVIFTVSTEGDLTVYIPKVALKAGKKDATKDIGTPGVGKSTDDILELTRDDVFGDVIP